MPAGPLPSFEELTHLVQLYQGQPSYPQGTDLAPENYAYSRRNSGNTSDYDRAGQARALDQVSATDQATSQGPDISPFILSLQCIQCGTTNSPEWRRGADRRRNLCNACGLFFNKLTKKFGARKADALMKGRRGLRDRSMPLREELLRELRRRAQL